MEVGGIQEKGPDLSFYLGQSEATGMARMRGKGDSGIHIPSGPILCHTCQISPPSVSIAFAERSEGWVQSCRFRWPLSGRRGESFGPWASIVLPGGWILSAPHPPTSVRPVSFKF